MLILLKCDRIIETFRALFYYAIKKGGEWCNFGSFIIANLKSLRIITRTGL